MPSGKNNVLLIPFVGSKTSSCVGSATEIVKAESMEILSPSHFTLISFTSEPGDSGESYLNVHGYEQFFLNHHLFHI